MKEGDPSGYEELNYTEQLKKNEAEEKKIMHDIESEVRSTVPQLEDNFEAYLASPNYQLLQDEAPTWDGRSLSLLCSDGLTEKVQLHRKSFQDKSKLFSMDAVINYYNWFRQDETEDFTLPNVLAATKRRLLSAYKTKDQSKVDFERYQDRKTLYRLLNDALNPPDYQEMQSDLLPNDDTTE